MRIKSYILRIMKTIHPTNEDHETTYPIKLMKPPNQPPNEAHETNQPTNQWGSRNQTTNQPTNEWSLWNQPANKDHETNQWGIIKPANQPTNQPMRLMKPANQPMRLMKPTNQPMRLMKPNQPTQWGSWNQPNMPI